MLVSTTKSGKGVLAEYTSTDMKTWEHAGVFMTMMWDRFYECPDVFKICLLYTSVDSCKMYYNSIPHCPFTTAREKMQVR